MQERFTATAGSAPEQHPCGGRRPLVDAVSDRVDRAETDALLVAAGRGDVAAFGAFYDRTVSGVFGMLRGVLAHPAPAERATVEVYRRLWGIAPGFDPAGRSAYATLLFLARRALTGRVHVLVAPAGASG